MSEQIPEDMDTGIPPIRGKSMLDIFLEAKVMEATGIHIDEIEVGRTMQYVNGRFRYYLTKQEGHGYSRFFADGTTPYSIVTVGRTDESGEVIEETAGLFIGVSVTDDGNCPVPVLPREGEAFRTISLESLPSPEQPDEPTRLLLFKGLAD